MNSSTVWSGENISTADLRPSTSSTFCTSLRGDAGVAAARPVDLQEGARVDVARP